MPESTSPQRIFLSHTSELRRFPVGGSFVDAAEKAVAEAGHAVVDMAYFAVRDDKTDDYCAAKVAGADIFVMIVGFRYGSPVCNRPDISYVEWEWEVATDRGLPRFVFLLDDAAEGPVEMFRDSLAKRQDAFRARLGSTGFLFGKVVTPADLRHELYKALRDNVGTAVGAPAGRGARDEADVVRSVIDELRTIAPHAADRARMIHQQSGVEAAVAFLRAEIGAMLHRSALVDRREEGAAGPLHSWVDARQHQALAAVDASAKGMTEKLTWVGPQVRHVTAQRIRERVNQLEPRVSNKRWMSPSAVRALYEDVAEQAVALTVQLLADVFADAVERALRTDLDHMGRAVSEFRQGVIERLADDTLRPEPVVPLAWSGRFPGSDVGSELSGRLLTASDLDGFLEALTKRPTSPAALAGIAVLPKGLLGLVLAVFLALMRDDLRTTTSSRVRLAVIRERIGRTLAEALDGDEVGQALTAAVEDVKFTRVDAAEHARRIIFRISAQVLDPEFAARYEERIYMVESAVERSSLLLAEIERRTT